ncbi:MAG: FlgD immunoglobulin-like domain containing protein, partial [Candidatus Eisenbacteria bacterium]|nr:FlgD immunoglobulin-like domain containing protein [Candidatus Eisenbacteria bacterium]
GAWGQGCAAAGVAESPAAGTPFLSCRPNPFAGSTQLVLARSPQSAARLEIFDASGRRVRSIDWPAGRASLSWDGADQAGRALPAGVYLYGMDGRSGRFLLLR